jgi:hypothetical protein
MEAIRFSITSVLSRATRRDLPEDGILQYKILSRNLLALRLQPRQTTIAGKSLALAAPWSSFGFLWTPSALSLFCALSALPAVIQPLSEPRLISLLCRLSLKRCSSPSDLSALPAVTQPLSELHLISLLCRLSLNRCPSFI